MENKHIKLCFTSCFLLLNNRYNNFLQVNTLVGSHTPFSKDFKDPYLCTSCTRADFRLWVCRATNRKHSNIFKKIETKHFNNCDVEISKYLKHIIKIFTSIQRMISLITQIHLTTGCLFISKFVTLYKPLGCTRLHIKFNNED